MEQEILLQDYNPNWQKDYEIEKSKLALVFAPIIKSIHHIGSTNIKSTRAKGEIDVLIVVEEDENIKDYDASMMALGYTPRGECMENGGTKGRFYYSKKVNGVKTHKVHVCKTGHKDILDKLLFCKYLKEHPKEAVSYSKLKEALGKKYNYAQIALYLKGKQNFIQSIIIKSRKKYSLLTEHDF